MDIKEIKFTTKKKTFIVKQLQINKIFESLKYNCIKSILKANWSGLNKFNMLKILIIGIIRKSVGKLSITPEMQYELVPYINKILDKDILFVEVVFDDKKNLIFDTGGIKTIDILMDIHDVIYANQYNISKKTIKGKIVIDVGANKGTFSLFCVFLGAKKVYAFEPVTSSNKNMGRSIKLNQAQDKIELFRKALADKNYTGKVSSRYMGDGGSRVSEEFIGADGWDNEPVEMVAVDDCDFGVIDFIKIDTEGFESSVLMGAEETIKKFKPILSFSAYHKSEDKKELPKLVKSIRDDYRIELNNFAEEDFYCY